MKFSGKWVPHGCAQRQGQHLFVPTTHLTCPSRKRWREVSSWCPLPPDGSYNPFINHPCTFVLLCKHPNSEKKRRSKNAVGYFTEYPVAIPLKDAEDSGVTMRWFRVKRNTSGLCEDYRYCCAEVIVSPTLKAKLRASELITCIVLSWDSGRHFVFLTLLGPRTLLLGPLSMQNVNE